MNRQPALPLPELQSLIWRPFITNSDNCLTICQSQNLFKLNSPVCVCVCVFFSSAESMSCSCDKKVPLHLQGLCSVSDGSRRQPDRQRPQRRGRTRDPLHLQVSESNATAPDVWLWTSTQTPSKIFSSSSPHKAGLSTQKQMHF